jgi:predicted Zn-dependent protease with MMP-like domain
MTVKEVDWTKEHTNIVLSIMDHLYQDCFLKLPSYDRPFYIATDYSGVGIGAVLMQEQGEEKKQLLPL